MHNLGLEPVTDISSLNLRAYSNARVVSEYGKAAGLQPPEMEILSRLQSEFSGRRILDIGVGGGRTTPFLIEISRNYLGIDYSPEMIEQCRSRYPGVDLRTFDVRDLSQLGEGTFDLVLFSYNGIDYIEHEDRIRVLADVRHVLSAGGAFVFSSHNRAASVRSAWSPDHLPLRTNPFRELRSFAHQLVRYTRGIRNASVNRRHERQAETYELRNDEGEHYSLVTYYIHIEHQMCQLADAGFRDCRAVALDGRLLEPRDYANTRDPWIHYLCRR